MSTALLLIAHGSRNAEANADLHSLAADLRRHGYCVVEPAFLELAEPTIADAGARCATSGASRVVLVPYFLSAGVHVREDLKKHRDELAVRFGAVDFVLAEPLGPHPLLAEIVLERVRTCEVG